MENCTLTICKPIIRRVARIRDWVIGTVSKNSKINDETYELSNSVVFDMKITDKKSFSGYGQSCLKNLKDKTPKRFTETEEKKRETAYTAMTMGLNQE